MRFMILGLCWVVACFYSFDYIDLSYLVNVPMRTSDFISVRVIEYLGALISFSVFIATFLYFQKLNLSAESKLKFALEQTNVQKNEIECQRKALEAANTTLSIRALSAQLNPHFLYNSLNSIQHFLTINDKTSSLNYLSKFGRLVRQFIDYSDQGVIPLQDELKLLHYYLELESLRFQSMFTYTIDVDDDLLLYNVSVPLLLVQVHVENAILHGLMNKQGERLLGISFKVDGGFMVCKITDNGIGRQASLAKKKPLQSHRSRGIEISTQRLNLMYDQNIYKSLIKIHDLYDTHGSPCGTLVIIRIPLEEI